MGNSSSSYFDSVRFSHGLMVWFQWVRGSLNRKFNFTVATGLLAISLMLLLLFLAMYRSQLEQDRAQASTQVNHLLQSALENAMLKRDLDGLRVIVNRLGEQSEIDKVMIVNPAGYVRFASNPKDLGRNLRETMEIECEDCVDGNARMLEFARFTINEQGASVLRSVNPVPNKIPCSQCHGSVQKNPVNGVLVVDYEAETIRHTAWTTTLTLMASGMLVVLLTCIGGWWFMGRFVLSPVARLVAASRALSKGHLDARVVLEGKDELAHLGAVFNEMAANLQGSLRVIQEKETFLQGLIDAIPDGVRVIDTDFSIVKANKSYRDQVHQELRQVEHAKCYASSHNRSQPCVPTMVTCPLHEITKDGKPIKALHQHRRRDGAQLYVEVFAAPLQVEMDGQRRMFIVESIRDIAKEINFSLEQKLATMGQLAAGVAHEIRNPLASIRLALQATLRVTDDPDMNFAQVTRYLKHVDDQIDKCIDVTERLLKLSAPAEGARQLVSLNEAIDETVSLLATYASERNVVIETQLTLPDVRTLAADSEIRMLVFNFVENAFHAMPSGGQLRIVSQRESGEGKMVFEDTGNGILPEDLPHIFEPFFTHRADGSQGAGLGLSICKSVVDRYGGRIEVASQEGEGARFTVVVPDADAKH